MKQKGNIIKIAYITLALVIMILPLVLMPFSKESNSENRKLSAKPSLVTEDGVNVKYLSGLGDYFEDHFGMRSKLVTMGTAFEAKIFRTSLVDDVIVGNNDWLYYSATVDDFQRKNVSDRMLFNMAHNMSLMQEYCEMLGKEFVFAIAPNKNSLYPQNMPGRYKYFLNNDSDAKRLKPYLLKEGVNYLDLFELFSKEDEILYYKKDSHWNNKGAVMVYNSLLEMTTENKNDYSNREPEIVNDYVGDLNRMLYSDKAVPESDYRYVANWNYTYENPDATVEDTTVKTSNPGGEGSLLMYRDSFGNSLLPYMADTFENALFSKVVPYPLTDIFVSNPDVVIVEKVERHIPTLAQVPPIMGALPRNNVVADKNVDAGIKAPSCSSNSGYYLFSGRVNPDFIDDEGRIYINIISDASDITYEAFDVSVGEKGGENDYLYNAYISSLNLEPGNVDVKIITEYRGENVVQGEFTIEIK